MTKKSKLNDQINKDTTIDSNNLNNNGSKKRILIKNENDENESEAKMLESVEVDANDEDDDYKNSSNDDDDDDENIEYSIGRNSNSFKYRDDSNGTSNEEAEESQSDSLENFDDCRKWNLEQKINDLDKYNSNFVKFLDAKVFDYKYIQENGFECPLVFKDKSGLGMRVPSENFKVSDVKSCVGSKRIIDVVDVKTQKGLTMSMKDWCEYYENSERNQLLNVISLEFSHTKLENYVEAPLVVRQLDWIDTAWPQYLRDSHTESTNLIEKMKYPKVQKYVLMSVAGCYTDFHIDMGGTSVWYHLLKGEKIFWLIPPTEENLKKYEKWILSGQQSSTFLPDIMDQCQRIVLQQGWTFMLPSGWIHGVYTTKDSLVFGGNFLHSFNIPMQLKIYNIETKTKVPSQYRYPFYIEMMWFVLERYVHCLTGITHMDELGDNNGSSLDDRQAYKTFQPTNFNLNKYEYIGLEAMYEFLASLSECKRKDKVPKMIVQSDLLFQSFKKILDEYNSQKPNEFSVSNTGTPFMHWPKPEKKYIKKAGQSNAKRKAKEDPNEDKSNVETSKNLNISSDQNDPSQLIPNLISSNSSLCDLDTSITSNTSANDSFGNNSANKQSRKHVMRNLPRTKGSIKKRLRPQNVPRSNVERRRRVRCHNCEPCTRDDCGECKYCKDMKKFGGTGISKQCCLSKQCLQPLLPTTTTCMLCEALIDRYSDDLDNLMYECEICFEIYHVQCFKKQYPELNYLESIINEDLNNCWQCGNCLNKGYIKQDETKKQENAAKLNQTQSSDLNNSNSNSLNASFIISLNSTNSNLNNSNLTTTPINTTPPIKSENFDTIIENNKHASVFLAPSSESPAKKPKRQRRTKEEIENSKLKIKLDPIKKPKSKREPIISIDQLTNYEKEIILNEFCEIYYGDDDNNNNTNNFNNQIPNGYLNQDHKYNFKFNSKNESSTTESSNGQSKSNYNANINKGNDDLANLEDDNIEYDLENVSFTSISVNNNDSNSTQNSFSETSQTDDFIEYEVNDQVEELIR